MFRIIFSVAVTLNWANMLRIFLKNKDALHSTLKRFQSSTSSVYPARCY
ncbi:hypothetical protein DNTS_002649 [Danionella cerebrum]|uniref:Uncharacterized protein n=1 Tax=Danionella cerebrum TaxID=2873325 RepID=A0A553QKJ8_9TELE|nr:hypothetical protein DNTS_002649 [Danionella translucida]